MQVRLIVLMLRLFHPYLVSATEAITRSGIQMYVGVLHDGSAEAPSCHGLTSLQTSVHCVTV